MDLRTTVDLLPTPVVNDMGAGKTPEQWEALKDKWQAKFGNNGHGNSLSIEALKLLPTPRAQNGEKRNMNIWKRPLDQPQNLENALARIDEPTDTDRQGLEGRATVSERRGERPAGPDRLAVRGGGDVD